MNGRFCNKPTLFGIDKNNFKDMRRVDDALIGGGFLLLEFTHMNKTLIPWLAAASAALLLTAPASADTTADLIKCRTALIEEGHFNNDQHSLKFSHRKGHTRKRTIFLTLKDRQTSSRQQVSCKLERAFVTGLTLMPKP